MRAKKYVLYSMSVYMNVIWTYTFATLCMSIVCTLQKLAASSSSAYSFISTVNLNILLSSQTVFPLLYSREVCDFGRSLIHPGTKQQYCLSTVKPIWVDSDFNSFETIFVGGTSYLFNCCTKSHLVIGLDVTLFCSCGTEQDIIYGECKPIL